ncbi:hypothetical protein LZ554_005196 [Drepanopeziza brunnea f. sp. 'monogermtubi']|nr:hypothetical protein LZ554_005196 [Drepanopeziza brunnea f. sp. 'monogermtubi']
MREPKTLQEVQGIYFWYWPGIFTGGQLQMRGMATWGTVAWTRLASGEFGEINFIRDIYDSSNLSVREFGNTLQDQKSIARALTTFIAGIPRAWLDILNSEEASELEQEDPWATRRAEFNPCAVPNLKGAREWTELSRLRYKESYQVMTIRASQRINTSHLLREVRESLSFLLHRAVEPKEIWLEVTSKKGRVPKCNNLLFRLLHDRVITGRRLEWVDSTKQICPLCHVDQTVEHI